MVGCEVVWAACGGIVTTPITQQQRSLSSCTEQQAAGSVSISRQPSVSTGEPGSASLSRHSSYEDACATQVAENEQRASPDVSEGSGEEPSAGRSRYTALETLASIQALAVSARTRTPRWLGLLTGAIFFSGYNGLALKFDIIMMTVVRRLDWLSL